MNIKKSTAFMNTNGQRTSLETYRSTSTSLTFPRTRPPTIQHTSRKHQLYQHMRTTRDTSHLKQLHISTWQPQLSVTQLCRDDTCYCQQVYLHLPWLDQSARRLPAQLDKKGAWSRRRCDIAHLYTPVLPTVSQVGGGWSTTRLPPTNLAGEVTLPRYWSMDIGHRSRSTLGSAIQLHFCTCAQIQVLIHFNRFSILALFMRWDQ